MSWEDFNSAAAACAEGRWQKRPCTADLLSEVEILCQTLHLGGWTYQFKEDIKDSGVARLKTWHPAHPTAMSSIAIMLLGISFSTASSTAESWYACGSVTPARHQGWEMDMTPTKVDLIGGLVHRVHLKSLPLIPKAQTDGQNSDTTMAKIAKYCTVCTFHHVSSTLFNEGNQFLAASKSVEHEFWISHQYQKAWIFWMNDWTYLSTLQLQTHLPHLPSVSSPTRWTGARL